MEYVNTKKHGIVSPQAVIGPGVITSQNSVVIRGKTGMEGTLYWYPKFYNNIILFVGSKTIYHFINISLVGSD